MENTALDVYIVYIYTFNQEWICIICVHIYTITMFIFHLNVYKNCICNYNYLHATTYKNKYCKYKSLKCLRNLYMQLSSWLCSKKKHLKNDPIFHADNPNIKGNFSWRRFTVNRMILCYLCYLCYRYHLVSESFRHLKNWVFTVVDGSSKEFRAAQNWMRLMTACSWRVA